MVSDSPRSRAQIGVLGTGGRRTGGGITCGQGFPETLGGFRLTRPGFRTTLRAPARSQPADPVWLLGLVVIGWQIALSYAEASDSGIRIAHSR
jgi:hypothetical protein